MKKKQMYDQKYLETMLDEILKDIGFDSAIIFASRTDKNGTMSHVVGGGNAYTHYGMLKQWVIHKEQKWRDSK